MWTNSGTVWEHHLPWNMNCVHGTYAYCFCDPGFVKQNGNGLSYVQDYLGTDSGAGFYVVEAVLSSSSVKSPQCISLLRFGSRQSKKSMH